MNEIDYSEMDDNEKTQYLNNIWNNNLERPFEFFGIISVFRYENGETVHFLSPVWTVVNKKPLTYPDSPRKEVAIFLGKNITDKLKEKHLAEGDFVKYKTDKLHFSSKKEQEKKGSVFVFSGSLKDLVKLHKMPPEVFSVFLSKIDDEGYLENWVIEQKHDEIKNIGVRIEKLKRDFEANYEAEKSKIESKYSEVAQKEQEKIDKLKIENQSLQEEYQESLQKIDNSKKQLEEIELNKVQASKELNDIKQEISDSIDKANNLLENNKKKILLLVQLGIIHQKDANNLLSIDIDSKLTQTFTGSYEAAIDMIQLSIYQKGSLYSKALLKNFCALLNSHDLILLAGDSGIGKTNLVKRFAEAVGGVSKIIPVKPNWTSSDDLLGYYNPIDRRYITTPFLDAIYEAMDNPNKLFLICLDEMNLARIEYYFADFLSKLEERSEDAVLELYSETEDKLISDGANELIDKLANSINIDPSLDSGSVVGTVTDDPEISKDISRLGLMESNRIRCKSRIKIPQNIRFIGTLNVDDTTYYLSPKIVDRVHVIRFDNPIFVDRKLLESEIDFDIKESININPQSFFDSRSEYPKFFSHIDSPLVKRLTNLSKKLSGIGLSYGARVIGQSLLYAESMKKFGESSEDIIFDNILLQKVFPRLLLDGADNACDGSSKTKLEVLEEIYSYLESEFEHSEDDISSLKELKKVINKAKNGNSQINYWIR